MVIRTLTSICVLVNLLACAEVDTGPDGDDFDAAPDAGEDGYDGIPRPDGAPCDQHEQCDSGVCIPVLPDVADDSGLCWGPDMHGCVRALGFDHWAEDPCTEVGMADALCPPTLTSEMVERCIVPTEPPSGPYPYPYICCETTML